MDTDEKDSVSRTKKILMISIIISVVLLVIIIILLVFFMYKEAQTPRINIDGVEYKLTKTIINDQYTIGTIDITENSTTETKTILLEVTEEDGVVPYILIKTLAQMQGYTYTLGEKLSDATDDTKCHISCSGEDVSFISGSNVIYKVVADSTSSSSSSELANVTESYETYTLEYDVIMYQGELYAPIDGIKYGFNSYVGAESTTITIQSLDYTIEQTSSTISSAGYTPSTVFKNQRALISGIAIVSKSSSSSSSGASYGLFSLSLETNISDMKYNSIEYLQNIDKYIVSSDGKYGIIEVKTSENGNLVINDVIALSYDYIALLDADKGLFIIQQLGSYGVIKDDGTVIIPTEYEEIGLTDVTENYPKQNLTNQYLLFDKVIPVKRDGAYALYDTEGNKLTGDNGNIVALGCTNATTYSSKGENILIVPEDCGLGYERNCFSIFK